MKFSNLKLSAFLIVFWVLISVPANAFIFAPALTYELTEEDNSKYSSLMADFRGGFKLGDRFFAGAMYHMQKADANGLSIDGWALGPSIGALLDNFAMTFTYHVLSNRDYSGSRYTDGSGPQFDFAYLIKSSKVQWGPQLTWRSLEYKKLEVNGNKTDAKKEYTILRPYLAFFFEF